jgi:hypothetical protein
MPEAITVEWLVTSPLAFGIEGATKLQRAICRAIDGNPLDDLASDPDVIKGFGGEAAIEYLQRPPAAPFEFYLIGSTRSAKSVIGAAAGIKGALTCDLDEGTSPGDTFEIPIFATKKRKARIIFRHLRDNLFQKPHFKSLMVGDPTTETIRMRRPSDGRIVDIVVTAGARAGAGAIGVWCCSAIFDEAARMIGEDDGVVNFDEQRRYALSRIRPGGQILAVTSPWAPMGPIYKAVQDHHGKPTADLIVARGTGPQMNPVWWTPKRCEQVRRSDEVAYQTDVLGNFANPTYGMFAPLELDRATRKFPEHATPQQGFEYGAAMDAATRSNAWTLVIDGCEQGDTPAEDRHVIAFVCQWMGSASEPARAKVIFPEMREHLELYGINSVLADRWSFDPFKEHAEDAGIELVEDDRVTAKIMNGWTSIQTMVAAEPPKIELHPDPVFKLDLLNTKKKLTQQGAVPDYAKTSDGRHSDYAPATERAVFRAKNAGVSWLRAMQAVENRGGELFEPDRPGASSITFCNICKMNYMGPCTTHGKEAT